MAGLADLFPGFESHTFKTSGAEIFARIGGDGPPLFLLHGYPQTHVMWHRVAPMLAQHFRLIIPDLRGYGASSVPESDAQHIPYSKRAMTRDIIDIAADLRHDCFFFCGHDRGARVGYRLALDHPERVKRLVLLDIVPTYDMWNRMNRDLALKTFHWPFLAQPYPWPENMVGRDPVCWLEHKLADWSGSGKLTEFDARALAHYRDFFEQPSRQHATCEDYRAGATCDLEADEADYVAGARITCPTAVFWGAKGIPSMTEGPLPIWREWCEKVEGRAIPSGHFLAEEAPDETARAILAFLTRADA